MTTFLLPADELEYAVLAKLWELGTASVRQLHEHSWYLSSGLPWVWVLPAASA